MNRIKQIATEAACVALGVATGLLFMFSLGVIARLCWEALSFGWAL